MPDIKLDIKFVIAIFITFAVALTTATPCAQALAPPTEVWVYTSIYKEFAATIEKAFEAHHPEINIQIFQAGSEKLQTKVEAELMAKRPQADLLVMSNPFWAADLERRGLALSRPKEQTIKTNYYSLMIIICHKDYPPLNRPSSFKDLTKSQFTKLIQLGSPLESGTMFAASAYLSDKYGWTYFEQLRDNKTASNGGNSTVIQKVESGEKKIGIVLLENALAARKRGSPIDIIYPSDGAIPIPSVQVILKSAAQPSAANLFSDFLLSQEGQKLLRDGFMHSVRSDVPPPEGTLTLERLTHTSTKWTRDRIKTVSERAMDIKKKFANLLLE